MIMWSPRRALFLFFAIACVACFPQPASAQCSGWNTSLYADAYYSENDGAFAVWGEGVDYDAGCGCYHAYGIELAAVTPSLQTYSEFYDAASGSIVGVLEAGATQYAVNFYVWCACVQSLVGFEQRQGQLNVPAFAAPCGTPIAFAQSRDMHSGAQGTLYADYIWASSTGRLEDLYSCTLYESLSYSPNPWPSPPWTYSAGGDHFWGSGPGGAANDSHDHGTITALGGGSVAGSQDIYYTCGCYQGGAMNTIGGTYSINRSVSTNGNGGFKYNISKSGDSGYSDGSALWDPVVPQ